MQHFVSCMISLRISSLYIGYIIKNLGSFSCVRLYTQQNTQIKALNSMILFHPKPQCNLHIFQIFLNKRFLVLEMLQMTLFHDN